MAMNKLERIEKDIEKTKGKIAARPEHDPAGVRRLCARRRVAGGPGPDPGL